MKKCACWFLVELGDVEADLAPLAVVHLGREVVVVGFLLNDRQVADLELAQQLAQHLVHRLAGLGLGDAGNVPRAHVLEVVPAVLLVVELGADDLEHPVQNLDVLLLFFGQGLLIKPLPRLVFDHSVLRDNRVVDHPAKHQQAGQEQHF